MVSKISLSLLCLQCEKQNGKQGQLCPFRTFFNDYCNEYVNIEKDLDKLEKIELIIKDYDNYKIKPYKSADYYIRRIKEVFG